MKGNLDDYKNILTGRLEYDYSIDDKQGETDYFGRIKLQKEPKFENFDNKNVILQGSTLKGADW